MLRRLLVVASLIILLGVVWAPTASACPTQKCDDQGNCWIEECSPGGGGSGGGGGGSTSPGRGGEKATTCFYGSTEVSCATTAGTWSSAVGAWCKATEPQPPATDAIWGGRTEGNVYTCTPPRVNIFDPDFGLSFQRWLPASPELPPPDPEVLAWRALAAVNLQPIDMGIAPEPLAANPSSLGAVGLPVWLWADTTSPNTTGPISNSASERGYTVNITARLKNITWDLGDGSAAIECGIGQRFDPASMGPQTPVACGRQAGYDQQGEYTITATSNWEVTWNGIGRSGVIPFQTDTSGSVRIGEIQVVVTDS
ncbi:hypothetical protein GCM10025789_31150 [Tessaracoccus lubricantis]|uniref:PKD domain-containing protein n=1 Tax=Tessaracoccus lubricantis TaxID=545543 RepID=A0ABP9FR16_9ACTN